MINSKKSFEEKKEEIKSEEKIIENELETKENQNPESILQNNQDKIENNKEIESEEIKQKKIQFSVKNPINSEKKQISNTENKVVKINEKYFN